MPSVTGSSTTTPPTSAYLAHYSHLPHSHPPSKASLKAWWNQFTSNQKTRKGLEISQKDGPLPTSLVISLFLTTEPDHPVFGKPLQESLRYASVQISTSDPSGRLYVWGYIPVVVAKW